MPSAESSAPLRLMFLGCGAIARRHARTLGGDRSVRIGFASRDGRRAESFRHRFGGFAASAGYRAGIERSDVDAVVVTTPPREHFALTLEALLAGKHVLVEKPAFGTTEEADLIAAAAKDAGRQVLVLENYSYKPLVRTLRGLLAEDAIGEVRFIRVNALKRQHDWGWRADPEQACGGALLEGGVHWLHLLATLGPRLESVVGFAPPVGGGLERAMAIVGRFDNGAIGTLHHGWDAPVRLKGLALSQIIGTRGTILFESNGLFVGVNAPGRHRLLFPGFRDIGGYRAMFADLLGSLRHGTRPVTDLHQARSDLHWVEEAYRTAGLCVAREGALR